MRKGRKKDEGRKTKKGGGEMKEGDLRHVFQFSLEVIYVQI
jgi:hypothetical protein